MVLNYKNYRLHLVIAVSWLVLYIFNYYVLAPLEYKSHISFIFLPAGLRIAFATIFRLEATIGLFLGSLLTGYFFLEGQYRSDMFVFALLSTFSPIAAVYSVNLFTNIGKKCENLNLYSVIAISFVYASYCAFFHNFYLFIKYDFSHQEFLIDFAAMFFGDLSGGVIFLTILASQRQKIIKYFMDY